MSTREMKSSLQEPSAAQRELTLAEAIKEALAEEMRRDPRVFIMGEDVAEAGTPFKVLSGLVGGIRHPARDRYADFGSGLHRPGRRCRDDGHCGLSSTSCSAISSR